MMKHILNVGAVLVIVVVLITLIGLMLPRAHRATRMIRLNQPPEFVFAAITGPQDWRPGVKRTDLPAAPGQPRQWTEQTRHGPITFEEVTCEPPRLYRSRIADEKLPFAGTWTYEVTPAADGRGCSVRITEDGEVKNPIFRFVGRFLIGYSRTIETYLRDLGRKFGASPSIEP